jgi:tRNA(Ile)-lysidine synthase
MDLLSHVGAFFDTGGLVGSAGIVAVSGGPDSVALAHALAGWDNTPDIVLAHCNHQLRGVESEADEEFVVGLSARWFPEMPGRLPCRVQRVDTAAEAVRRGQNLEATARDQRYSWLAQVARETGAAWVAVAHTADDQAETVLFRLLRGTGVEGLRGMSLRRPLDGPVDLVRPLLGVRRQDVLDYLEANALPYRLDSSNRDTTFTRNRLRRELIPQLEHEYNPALVDALCRLARQADEVQMEMRRLAEELLAQAELARAGATLVFRADVLTVAAPHRAREMFRLVWQREKWPQSAMGFDEWQRLVAVVHDDATAWDLPGGVRVRRAGRVIQVTLLKTVAPAPQV